jgi:hypothetical protein
LNFVVVEISTSSLSARGAAENFYDFGAKHSTIFVIVPGGTDIKEKQK